MTCHASRTVITLNHPYAGVVVAYIKNISYALLLALFKVHGKNGPIGFLLFNWILLKQFQIKFVEGMQIVQVIASGLNIYLAVMVASVITTFQLVMPTRRKKYATTYCSKKKHVRNKCPVIFELFIYTAYAVKNNGQRDSRTKKNWY